MSILKFSLYYLAYSLLLALVAWYLPHIFPGVKLMVKQFWLIFGFLCLLTYIAYIVATIGLRMNPETGVMAVMGSIVLKMIFSMAFVLVYSMKTNEKGLVFTLNFFSLYLLFSFFEIYSLLLNLRHQNK